MQERRFATGQAVFSAGDEIDVASVTRSDRPRRSRLLLWGAALCLLLAGCSGYSSGSKARRAPIEPSPPPLDVKGPVGSLALALGVLPQAQPPLSQIRGEVAKGLIGDSANASYSGPLSGAAQDGSPDPEPEAVSLPQSRQTATLKLDANPASASIPAQPSSPDSGTATQRPNFVNLVKFDKIPAVPLIPVTAEALPSAGGDAPPASDSLASDSLVAEPKTVTATAQSETPAKAEDSETARAAGETAASGAADTPAQVAATSGGAALLFGALRSPDFAAVLHGRLSKGFADLLEGRELRTRRVELETGGVSHQVRLGPYASFARAEAACRRFKARKQHCAVIELDPASAVPPTPASRPERTAAVAGAVAIQFAALRSPEFATELRDRLIADFADLVARRTLWLDRAQSKSGGLVHLVRLGPYGTPAEASEACRHFEARQQDCIVVRR